MLHGVWLDIPWVIIVHPFCFTLGMVSDNNTRRNIFTIMFLCLFHKGITAKRVKAHVISQKCLFKDRSLSLGNPWIAFLIGEVVSPPTPTFGYLSQVSCLWDLQYLWQTYVSTTTPSKSLWTESIGGLRISCVATLERPIGSWDFSCEHEFDEVFMK